MAGSFLSPCIPLRSLTPAPTHSALLESLINPLQERIEDWKKSANQLDKDHAKGGTGLLAGSPLHPHRTTTRISSFVHYLDFLRVSHHVVWAGLELIYHPRLASNLQ